MPQKLSPFIVVLGLLLSQPVEVFSIGLPDRWERAGFVIEISRLPGRLCPPSWRETTSPTEEAAQPEFCPDATGFLMSICGQVVLVTNRHVFQQRTVQLASNNQVFEHTINRFIRAGRKSGGVLRLPVGRDWQAHPNPKIDLAASLVELPAGVEEAELDITALGEDTNRQAAEPTSFFLDLSQLRSGDEILTIGFPSSIPGIRDILKTHGKPLLRGGVISLLIPGDTTIGNNEYSDIFLVDSWNFQGNSGSPVFWKPSIQQYADRGFKIERPYIIGVVSGFLNWNVPIQPTTQPALVAQTNAGLAIIQAADGIEPTVAQLPGAACVPRPKVSQ